MHRNIWSLHLKGLGTRQITAQLKDFPEGRWKVWKLLQKLQIDFRSFLGKDNDLSKAETVFIRDGLPEDRNFIHSTWLNTLYHFGLWRNRKPIGATKIPAMGRAQMFKYNIVIENILAKKNVVIKVCCLKEDPSIVCGYSVYEEMPRDNILHWVYVKEDWQREGIATDLCPKFTIITHHTEDSEAILRIKTAAGLIRPKLISLPLAYEILENTFKSQIHQTSQPKQGEQNDRSSST